MGNGATKLASKATVTCLNDGADCRDDQGRTALHWAASQGSHQAGRLLLEAATAMQAQHQAQPDSPDLPRLQCMQVALQRLHSCFHHNVSLRVTLFALSSGCLCSHSKSELYQATQRLSGFIQVSEALFWCPEACLTTPSVSIDCQDQSCMGALVG